MSARPTPPETVASLRDDLAQACCDVDAVFGPGYAEAHPGVVTLAMIGLSLERLRLDLANIREANAWRTSDKGMLAKAQELGITPRPGESFSDLRARIEARIVSK
ncbi:MAG: hypothetical protein HGA47_05495 [Zoogloea sp.]|nr:hypothetical protein [Zoogloea sp.]